MRDLIDFFILAVIPLFLLSAIFFFCLCSCDVRNEDGSIDLENNGIYHIIVIDSCEYIKGPYSIVHKGNCKFCLEHVH